MLKQEYFFKAIQKEGLNFNQYAMLFYVYNNPHKSAILMSIRDRLPLGYINDDLTLTERAIKLIKGFEKYFASKKSLSTAAAATPEFLENLQKYILIFPQGVLPSGKHARGDKKNIEKNMLWFFTEYDYDWDTILKATQMYVDEYRRKSTPYEYMVTAMYFIVKEKNKQLVSELANYCSLIREGYVAEQPRIIKTRVV